MSSAKRRFDRNFPSMRMPFSFQSSDFISTAVRRQLLARLGPGCGQIDVVNHILERVMVDLLGFSIKRLIRDAL
ncbi:hypothetical protein KIN20_031835 [Parelaphostrongylus tenuis]|uniref:Uncharacterized protein n=1 Tax=Parelaphostrongylus tenuis TaxID=148309 RepID=A0AAD5R5R9_PARTN|nr:hypothetical protein KIN20_031835 [Parelaphostrongylus tenuis]